MIRCIAWEWSIVLLLKVSCINLSLVVAGQVVAQLYLTISSTSPEERAYCWQKR